MLFKIVIIYFKSIAWLLLPTIDSFLLILWHHELSLRLIPIQVGILRQGKSLNTLFAVAYNCVLILWIVLLGLFTGWDGDLGQRGVYQDSFREVHRVVLRVGDYVVHSSHFYSLVAVTVVCQLIAVSVRVLRVLVARHDVIKRTGVIILGLAQGRYLLVNLVSSNMVSFGFKWHLLLFTKLVLFYLHFFFVFLLWFAILRF